MEPQFNSNCSNWVHKHIQTHTHTHTTSRASLPASAVHLWCSFLAVMTQSSKVNPWGSLTKLRLTPWTLSLTRARDGGMAIDPHISRLSPWIDGDWSSLLYFLSCHWFQCVYFSIFHQSCFLCLCFGSCTWSTFKNFIMSISFYSIRDQRLNGPIIILLRQICFSPSRHEF